MADQLDCYALAISLPLTALKAEILLWTENETCLGTTAPHEVVAYVAESGIVSLKEVAQIMAALGVLAKHKSRPCQ